ncbi:LptA/OstA family protein [Marinicellulosiphila megalodicopiae]|uniref:LptA/OstA family protein n=1 Tax=Marinicellulosiphila megalodicopiae TaxID=2724896 RepID=UPI003BB0BF97
MTFKNKKHFCSLLRSFFLIVSFLVISPVIFAQTFQILAKSTSIRELENELLTIHLKAVASNAEIKIIGDILEDHRDLETSTTQFLDVKGSPAQIELTNEKQQRIVVTADHITYEVITGLIIAQTHAKITFGTNYTKGHKITYALDGSTRECSSDLSKPDSFCETVYDSQEIVQ